MELVPFQEQGVNFLLSHQRAILGDEMGLGKTVQALVALYKQNKFPSLVIAPASLKWVWATEVQKWKLPLKVQVIHGTKEARIAQLSAQADIYIVGYEIARICAVKLSNMRFYAAVLDEAHRIKNRRAKTTKAILQITKNCQYIWLLTGTPIINRASELYSLLHVLDRRRFSSYWRFVGEHCIVYNNGFGWSVEDITDATDPRVMSLRRVLAEFLLRRRRIEVVPEMPKKTIQRVYVDLGTRQRRIYDQMKEEMVANMSPDAPIFAPTVVAQLMRLRQITIDPTLMENDVSKPLSGPKVDAALEIIEDTDESIVVFSNFSRVIKRFSLNLIDKGISHVVFTGDTGSGARRKAIRSFGIGKARIFLATLGAGGQGLNLDKASVVIFLDKSFSPALNSQAQDRVYRMSQTRPVTIYEIIAHKTVEEKIEGLLKHKYKVQQTVLKDLLTT